MGAQSWIAVGTDAAWSAETHMLAHAVDLLAGANWQRAGKGDAPKPIARPAEAQELQAKRERIFLKAAQFRNRKQARTEHLPPTTTHPPRDRRGRFVSKKG